MKNQVILGASIALIVGGIGGYLISNLDRYGHGGMMGGWDIDSRDRDDRTLNNTKNDDTAMGMGGMHNMHGMGAITTERKFLEEMIPHHQEAVDTAKQVVERGSDAETKALAQDIVTAQEKEIADTKSWYKAWYGVEYADKDTYSPMMRDLTKLSGTELDKAFLEDMVMHHMGALMMAQSVSSYVEHQEVKDLAKAIDKTQSSEIATMRTILQRI
jgi:uncharacterized protein (DUF305 family)